jgi:hypothetical protein
MRFCVSSGSSKKNSTATEGGAGLKTISPEPLIPGDASEGAHEAQVEPI